MDPAAAAFFAETQELRPKDLAALRSRVDGFLRAAVDRGQRVALVTSGGTTVPLELNTVRFIDNFSTGTRGARCSEQLLAAGYAVLLLHRRGSNFPFLSDLQAQLQADPVAALAALQSGQTAPVAAPPLGGAQLAEQLLPLPFTTIFEYLFLLREACQALAAAGPGALVLLAAAVSDFYVPEAEMAREKIQSRAHDGLRVELRNVPKLLGDVKRWAPEAFVVSFKLETNENILLAKAAGALAKYNVDAVCSNLLQTYRDLVTVISRESMGCPIEIDRADIVGDESEPVGVKGVSSLRIERGSTAAIDSLLISALLDIHKEHLASHTSAAGQAIRPLQT